MEKINLKSLKKFFSSKRSLIVLQGILTVIAIYYSIITCFFLVFLLPLIVMWATGSSGVEFLNVYSSKEIQRTDISYFTTGDLLDTAKLLSIIAILIFGIVILRKIEKKFD